MKNSDNIAVRLARHSDIGQMIEVCAQNLVENNREKFAAVDFSRQGFLIGKLTEEDAKKYIDDQENYFVCVATDGEEVLGYLTGCDVKKSGIDFFSVEPSLKKIQNEKIFYHKQIVKKLDAKNIGKKLLFAMFDEVKSRAYSHVICRIVHEPFYNEASISFHEKFGFQEVGSMEESGRVKGLKMGIYLKKT